MDDYYRLKTTKTKPRTGTPGKQEKRKEWRRTNDKRRLQGGLTCPNPSSLMVQTAFYAVLQTEFRTLTPTVDRGLRKWCNTLTLTKRRA